MLKSKYINCVDFEIIEKERSKTFLFFKFEIF